MIGYEFECFSFLFIAILFSARNVKKKRFHSFHCSDRHNRRIQKPAQTNRKHSVLARDLNQYFFSPESISIATIDFYYNSADY